jgi:hypothetical protein
LNTQNYFYSFLKLAGILQKGKIDLLKKKKNGPGRRTLARSAQIRALPGPGMAEPVRCRPIQIRRRTTFLPRAIAHAGEASQEG